MNVCVYMQICTVSIIYFDLEGTQDVQRRNTLNVLERVSTTSTYLWTTKCRKGMGRGEKSSKKGIPKDDAQWRDLFEHQNRSEHITSLFNIQAWGKIAIQRAADCERPMLV